MHSSCQEREKNTKTKSVKTLKHPHGPLITQNTHVKLSKYPQMQNFFLFFLRLKALFDFT